MSSQMGSNPADIRIPSVPKPKPLNLRQREVIALETIAKTLEDLLVRVEWYFEYARNR
jgi:hypothetical protein